jgi:2-iminobutanoate/2-iminopropanoate deaminase
MRTISTGQAPTPAGHYSQAVAYAGLVFVAGQLPIEDGRPRTDLSAGDQTKLALRNADAILLAAGSDLAHTLKITVYVPDVALWPAINEAYAEVLGDHRPARVVVPTRDLHHGVLVEVDAIAAAGA